METVDAQSERATRVQKIDDLVAHGVRPFDDDAARTHTIAQTLDAFDALRDASTQLTLAGRLMGVRLHGGSAFADLQDGTGRIQLLMRRDTLGDEQFATLKSFIDHADFIAATGTLMITKVGERTLEVTTFKLLAKALLPLPEKWHGLQDIETRYRQRELDLLANPEVRDRFVVRSKLIASLRTFLHDRGFLEVDTPVLQAIPGGASARPFVTHHNALDVDLYLRIAPELYLKRLIIGGFEKVYEIGRCFRNEGIDYAHNPEFTMLELYWAYTTPDQFVMFIEELLAYAISEAAGTLHIAQEPVSYNFETPWPRTTFRQAIIDATGIDINELHQQPEELIQAARTRKLDVDFNGCIGWGEHCDQLFKKTARAQMIQPVWVFDYPRALKPLAKTSPSDPQSSASVQLIVGGAEIVNAYYHELNDPLDQRQLLVGQQALRDRGSEEAQWLDEDFLRALEHGMPPTSGLGIGIDRLTALVTGANSLKEVILFPTLRPIIE